MLEGALYSGRWCYYCTGEKGLQQRARNHERMTTTTTVMMMIMMQCFLVFWLLSLSSQLHICTSVGSLTFSTSKTNVYILHSKTLPSIYIFTHHHFTIIQIHISFFFYLTCFLADNAIETLFLSRKFGDFLSPSHPS